MSGRPIKRTLRGRRRKTVHAARRPEERPKDASHSSTFTECTAAMLTLPSFAGPTSARSVTRTVRMRFSVGTGERRVESHPSRRRVSTAVGTSPVKLVKGGCPMAALYRSTLNSGAPEPAARAEISSTTGPSDPMAENR